MYKILLLIRIELTILSFQMRLLTKLTNNILSASSVLYIN